MTDKLKIGLALSGGGSRAMAFHLGCLRALHDLKLLDQVEVVSTVSGGSVIGGMFVANRDPFPEFEKRVREHLAKGFVRPSLAKALTTSEGIRALYCWTLLVPINLSLTLVSWFGGALSRLMPPERRKDWKLDKLHSPFRRFASRTTILQKVFDEDVFKGQKLKDLPENRPLLIVNAAELRTGSAFYFSQKSSGTWRIGELAKQDISLAHAVSASAAYPLFLPALDEVLPFNAKDGTRREERVILSDGGIYDNLGLAPLWPDRDPQISLNVTKVDTIICCRAGYGLRFDAPTQFLLARMKSVFFCIFDRTQNAATKRLFDLLEAGKLKGVIMPYLGQYDARLACPPDDLVTREEAYALRMIQKVGVEAELQDRSALGLACKLGVYDFIGPSSEVAWFFHASQHVGPARPPSMLQRPLNYDFRTRSHCRLCRAHTGGVDVNAVDCCDREAFGFEVVNESLLMAATPLLKDFQQRVPSFWFRKGAFGHTDIERRQMFAV